MSSRSATSPPSLLQARVRLPQHVVYRRFPSETVVLNLQTGKYLGLKPAAGSMLEALERAPSVLDAAGMAKGRDQPLGAIERDMCDLCDALLSRGLIEIDGDGGA